MIQICRLMWTQDAPTFTGKHFHITEAAAPPKPEIVPPDGKGGIQNGQQFSCGRLEYPQCLFAGNGLSLHHLPGQITPDHSSPNPLGLAFCRHA
jgi:hypothetical protein